MKSSPFLRISLVLLAWTAAAFSTSSAAEPERPYLVIPETTSPDGRYAIVWSLPKGPQLDWEKFRAGERGSDYLPDLTKPENAVADDLVELASGRKLAAVASGYWALPGGGPKSHPDDEFMEVAWSAPSNCVLVLHRLRSGRDWGSLRAVQLGGGQVVSQLESGDALEAAVRSHLKKLYPQEYERGEDHLNLRISDLKSLGGSRFSLKAIADLENEDGNRRYRGATIKFELRAGKNGRMSLHVLGFSKIYLDEAP